MALFVDEVEDVDELPEPAPNCEISCSSLLEKLEEADVAPEDADEDALSFEPGSDSTAANRSCANFLNACRV